MQLKYSVMKAGDLSLLQAEGFFVIYSKPYSDSVSYLFSISTYCFSWEIDLYA